MHLRKDKPVKEYFYNKLNQLYQRIPTHNTKIIVSDYNADTRTVKKIFKWKPLTKRSQGKPKYRWEDNIKQDICQMKIKNWKACIQNRGKRKDIVEKAKTFNH